MPSPPGPGRGRHRAGAQRDRVHLGVADRERDDNLFQTLTQPQRDSMGRGGGKDGEGGRTGRGSATEGTH